MCITFFHINPLPRPGLFRLVLVMNRDEVLDRATETAEIKAGILAGRDMTPGKEGGTWLGVDTVGARVGFLTNIYTGSVEKDAKGRGSLVTNFLSGSKSAGEYLKDLASEDALYNPFNLFLFDKPQDSDSGYSAKFYCRGKPNHVVVSEGPEGLKVSGETNCFGIGNHPPSSPYLKTGFGVEKFREIIKSSAAVETKQELVDALLELMCSEEKSEPDPQMRKQAGGIDVPYHRAAASLFVKTPTFGTRTQTVVLIDHDYRLTFVEKNREAREDGSVQWNTKMEEIIMK